MSTKIKEGKTLINSFSLKLNRDFPILIYPHLLRAIIACRDIQ